jgi:hypothetical protein
MGYSVIPWREIGNGLLSSAVFLLAFYGARMGLPEAAATGAVTWLGYRLTFGTDLTLAEFYADVKGLPPEVVNQLMNSARNALERIRKANEAIPDRSLTALLKDITDQGEDILRQLQEDPAKLPQARRFLTVYLDGTAEVSEKFATIGRQTEKVELGQSYMEFLEQTKDTFAKQKKALLADDEFNLDVEIDVLKKRMTHESV